MKKLFLLLIATFFFAPGSIAQEQHLVDSLEAQLKNHNATKLELNIKSPSLYDTTAANILYALCRAYVNSNPDKAREYANQTLLISEQIGFKKGILSAYNGMGMILSHAGDNLSALELFKKCLNISKEIRDKKGIASAYNNIGIIYDHQANYPEALKYYLESLKIKEEIGDKKGLGNSYNNIGSVHASLGNYAKALENYSAALRISEELGNMEYIADSYDNIGTIHRELGNHSEALKNMLASFKIRKEIGDKQGQATSYLNLGNLYNDRKNYAEALTSFFNSLKIVQEIGNKRLMAAVYTNIAGIYIEEKKFEDAAGYLNKALVVSKETEDLEEVKYVYAGLALLDSAQGNFKQALEHYKLFIIIRDSLNSQEKTENITQIEMNYDFDKRQLSDSLKFAKEKEVGEIKLQKQKAITYGSFTGIAITIILLFFVYRNYSKQRIANQKLKEAQEQLIKSEKLAAFGLMASRVSHEIQNPLNFVNNFSELSQEMVTDVISSQSEEDKKQSAEALIANLQKINEHGKRAAGIVKQLQEHTIKGTAQEFFENNKPAD